MTLSEIFEKLFAILISVIIFAQAYLARRMVGTWIFPACLFSLIWFFLTFFPLIFLFSVPVDSRGMVFILLCLCSFSLSAVPFNWVKAFEDNCNKNRQDSLRLSSNLMRWFLFIFSLVAVIATVAQAYSNGFELSSMVLNVLESSGEYAAMRGRGELDYNNWARLGVVSTYAAAVVGGLVVYNESGRLRKGVLIFFALIPSLFVMLTQSAKLTFFLSLGFFFSAVLIQKIFNNKLELMSIKSAIRWILLGALLLPFFAVSLLSRDFSSIEAGEGVLERLLTSFFSYAFAHVYAFSDWFSYYFDGASQRNYVDNFYSFGNYTFQSVFQLFSDGIDFPPGIYDEYFSFDEIMTSNLYTIFRGLIYDFGGVGSIVFLFLGGLVVHAFFYRLLSSRRPWVACTVFMISVVCFQASYIISLLMARYMYLLFVVLILMFCINDVFLRRVNKNNAMP